MSTYTILYRASDHQFGVHAKRRYFSTSKTEIVSVCFYSMYREIKKYKNIKIKILADGLTDELAEFFLKFDDIEIVHLDHTTDLFDGSKPHYTKNGLRRSLQNLVKEIHKCNTDYIWIQEDDYLFDHKLIKNIFSFHQVEHIQNNREHILFLSDYKDKYVSKYKNESWKLFCESNMWWREIPNITFSFIGKREYLIPKHYLFEEMFNVKKYKNFDSFLSQEILHDSFITSPIPSINAHLDENVDLPAFTDWKKIWNDNLNKVQRLINE